MAFAVRSGLLARGSLVTSGLPGQMPRGRDWAKAQSPKSFGSCRMTRNHFPLTVARQRRFLTGFPETSGLLSWLRPAFDGRYDAVGGYSAGRLGASAGRNRSRPEAAGRARVRAGRYTCDMSASRRSACGRSCAFRDAEVTGSATNESDRRGPGHMFDRPDHASWSVGPICISGRATAMNQAAPRTDGPETPPAAS
jgi:hypothetical protein